MTTDTKAIRAQMEALAAAPDMRETILTLCGALDAAKAENERLGRELNMAKYGKPDFAWSTHLEAMADLQAENERLRAALKPFAEAEQYCDPAFEDNYSPSWALFFTLGDFRRARAALAAMEKGMSEWQPIDTAPKDGEMILVCLPRMMNLIVRARFNTVHKYWVTDYEGEGGIKVPHFFHPGDVWLPMPPPPTKGGA